MYEQVQKRNKSSSSSTSRQNSSSVQRQARKAKETQSKDSNSTKAVDSVPTSLMQPLAAPAPLGGEETAEAVRQGVKASMFLPGKLKFSTKVPFIKRGSDETQQAGATPLANDETQQVGATPLANDELILSTNIDEHSYALFSYATKYLMENWQLSISDSDIQQKLILLGSEEKQAVILKWNKSWGQKPISFGSSSSIEAIMNAIEARTSVAALHQLQGWGKLDSSSQDILNKIFSGETNKLSKHSRNILRNKFDSICKQPATTQEEILRNSAASNKNFVPKQVREPVTSEKVGYSVPTVPKESKMLVHGKSVDAERWYVEFDDGASVGIITPKAPELGYHNNTVCEIADAVSHLSMVRRELITAIYLEPLPNPDDTYLAAKYNIPNLQSAMAANKLGIINVFPRKETVPLPDKDSISVDMIHETAHVWSQQKWGKDTSKDKWLEWKDSMNADKVSVSEYAMVDDIQEDLAETDLAYTSTKGSPSFEEYRQIVPNRFAMLDKEYEEYK